MIQVLHHVRRVHPFVQMLNVLTFALLPVPSPLELGSSKVDLCGMTDSSIAVRFK
jgi:hypothetical protein